MVRKFLLFFFIVFFSINVFSQRKDLNSALRELSDSVIKFLRTERHPSISIISLKNFTEMSDDAVQKIYQSIVYRLESNKFIHFKDSMISLKNSKGVFNLKRNNDINYLMSLTFIRNKTKIGVGTSIFSVNQDKNIFLKYLEWDANTGEIAFLNIENKQYAKFGFKEIVEINAKKDLLDVKTFKFDKENTLFYFYYPNHIDILKKIDNTLVKSYIIRIDDRKDIFPVIRKEGKIFVFAVDDKKIIIEGNNFSKKSGVYINQNGKWRLLTKINFIPFEIFLSNGKKYFIGGNYDVGKNYFKGRIILKSIEDTLNNSDEVFYKETKPFFSIAFYKENDKIASMYMVDKDYNFINYGSNFELLNKAELPVGFAFAILNNKWLVKTMFSEKSDRLSFYKLREDELNEKYIKDIDGEVVMLSNGDWNELKGIWVLIKTKIHNYYRYKLQFWSKENEK